MAQMSINPCLPAADPCRSPIVPLFQSGISIRQAPLCEGPLCDCPQPSYGRARISAAGTLDRTHWIEGWIYSQLTTRGEIGCEEHTLRKRAGGWWADSFRQPASFRSGSKLWSLQWAFVTNEALIMAKSYATQALAPLMTWGIASRIKVEATYISRKVMHLAITVTGPGLNVGTTLEGIAMPESSWLWQEYAPTNRRGGG